MIVVHIDTTTDGHTLIDCYADKKETDTILVNPSRALVREKLEEKPNETLMCLGHGSPGGLFGYKEGYVIDGTLIDLLKDREIIGIWCHAKDFGKKYGLKGFFTSMFVSNPSEASWFRFNKVSDEVTQEQNTIFSKKVNDLIKNEIPLVDWIGKLQDYDKSLDFVCFNYENIEYLDGSKKEDTDKLPFDDCLLEDETTEDIMAELGLVNDRMRDCISRLRLSMGFDDSIDYDGDTITKEQLDKWEKTFEEIDKVCYYV